MGKHHSKEQIDQILKSANNLSPAQSIKQFCRQNKIGRTTYYRWIEGPRSKNSIDHGQHSTRRVEKQTNEFELQLAALRVAVEGNLFALYDVVRLCVESNRDSGAQNDLLAGR